jgi:hypothetical protein
MEQNKALSLPKKRLAGNSQCLNCGTQLAGPFCHFCGQPDKNLLRFFPVLLRELAEDFLDFDSRFMRTMKPLLFKPGRLTRDYLDGRRFRYTPPLRLYIFASIAFLFVASILTSSAVELSVNRDGDGASVRIDTASDELNEAIKQEDFEAARQAIEQLDPQLRRHFKINEEDRSIEASLGLDMPFGRSREILDENTAGDESGSETSPDPQADPLTGLPGDAADSSNEWSVQFNDKPWDRETNPLIIPLFPGMLNDWINGEIAKSPEKSAAIEANPNLIIDKIFDVLPVVLFVLLPLAALIMKFWYLFTKRYYVEHLIFALHNHSFLFVVLLLSLLSNALKSWLDPDADRWISTAVNGFNFVILAWIPFYFLLALKTVYQQGWGMTLVKYVLVGGSYFVLLISVTVFVALLSFLLM